MQVVDEDPVGNLDLRIRLFSFLEMRKVLPANSSGFVWSLSQKWYCFQSQPSWPGKTWPSESASLSTMGTGE